MQVGWLASTARGGSGDPTHTHTKPSVTAALESTALLSVVRTNEERRARGGGGGGGV